MNVNVLRCLGCMCLLTTLVYAYFVTIPAYTSDYYLTTDRGIVNVPQEWRSSTFNPLVIIVILPIYIPGHAYTLVVLISMVFIFNLVRNWQQITNYEKIFWISTMVSSWIFFWYSINALEWYARVLYD